MRERERETEGGRERERALITAAIEHNNNNNNSGTAQTRNLLTSKFGQPTESGSQLQKSPYIFLAMYKYMSMIKKKHKVSVEYISLPTSISKHLSSIP